MALFDPLTLPNGTLIPNRIAKAAMEENMATATHAPSHKLMRLYQTWANGGSGLLITGNVMVDSRAMTGPGGVVLENDQQLEDFKRWAQIGRSRGAQFWMQINHPGRQMANDLGQETWAPSNVPVNLGKLSKHFNPPKEMSESMILQVINRFVRTAQLAEQAGFTGVEIHSAHGYLLSQFLSPLTNKRTDKWGGSIANRSRMLLAIVNGIRAVVSERFAVAVKLNSADFQRGGFSADDAKQVVHMLNELRVDLVEISGGSYEAPAMHGTARDGRTLAREAYFLEFAKDIQATATMPIMVTGGIRRREIAEQVISSNIQMVGMGTALAIAPNTPLDWLEGKNTQPKLAQIKWKNKPLASLAYMAVVKYQLRKHSVYAKAKPNVSPLWALIIERLDNILLSRAYRKRIAKLTQ